MNFLLTGQHVEITPAIRAHVYDKMQKVIRHFDQILEIEVILGIEKTTEKDKRHRAEVNLRVKGHTFHLDNYADDMYKSIDLLVDRLDRQVSRHHARIKDHQGDAIKHAMLEETLIEEDNE